jgi:23S rRNA (guanosine2251-2'-O)-methyltransferase
VSVVARDQLAARAGAGANHQGVVAIAAAYEYAELSELCTVATERGEPALILVLDEVTDPHNLGAVLRSAHLFGAHGVVIPHDRSAPVNAVVTKVSAGASEYIRVARVTNLARALAELKQAGLWLAALAVGPASRPLWEFDGSGPIGLVLGSEGKGIRRRVAQACDHHVVIPMSGAGVGSFNVSVVAGVALYEIARQRGAQRL